MKITNITTSFMVNETTCKNESKPDNSMLKFSNISNLKVCVCARVCACACVHARIHSCVHICLHEISILVPPSDIERCLWFGEKKTCLKNTSLKTQITSHRLLLGCWSRWRQRDRANKSTEFWSWKDMLPRDNMSS